MTTKTPEELAAFRAKIVAELEESIARMEADTRDDDVLGWPENQLAMKWREDGQGHVTHIDNADPWRPGLPTVTNGAGARAIRCKRQDLIRANVDSLRKAIAMVPEMTQPKAGA